MKNSLKSHGMRGMSFILFLIFIFVNCSFGITALPQNDTLAPNSLEISNSVVQNSPSAPDENFELTFDEPLMPGEKTLAELQTMRIEDVILPETVTMEMAQQNGHINRLYAQEDLKTIVFQNQSGNMTAYVYNQPVKYVANDGTVRDKNTAITVSPMKKYAYAMIDNDITAYFSSKATDGVSIHYNDIVIEMKPQDAHLSSIARLGNQDNIVIYPNAFGNHTMLKYETKLNGVKEDIVLLKNTNQNVFNFTFTATGVVPIQENGKWVLHDSNGNTVIDFGEIIIYDSAGKQVEGTLSITNHSNGYTMSIHAPQEFLVAPDTVYPVYIDPTISVYNYDNDIIDTGLYSTQEAANNAQNNPTKHFLNESNGKILYRFPGFCNNGNLTRYKNQYAIGKVTLYISVGAGDGGTISALPMQAAWNGSNIVLCDDEYIWNGESTVHVCATSVPAGAGEYGVDITDIVRGWASYNNGEDLSTTVNPVYGFVLSSNFSSARTVDSTEGDMHNNVWYQIDYTGSAGIYYIIHGNNSTNYLTKSATSIVEARVCNDRSMWLMDYVGNNKYLISNVCDGGYFLDSDAKVYRVLANDRWSLENSYYWQKASATNGVMLQNCATNKVLCASSSTVSTINKPSSSSSNYLNATWILTKVSNFVPLQSFTISNSPWLAVGNGSYSTISVTPNDATFPDANHFTWVSSNPGVAAVTQAGLVTGVSPGYAYITATHNFSNVSSSMLVAVGTPVENGLYFIRLAQDSIFSASIPLYMNASNIGVSGVSPIEVDAWVVDEYSQWQIQQQSDGYYTIQSTYNQQYLGVDAIWEEELEQYLPLGGQEGTKLSPDVDESTKWAISISSSGNYTITSKIRKNYHFVLGTAISIQEESPTQLHYSDNSSHNDEWILITIGTINLVPQEGQSQTNWCWVTSARMMAQNYSPNVTYTCAEAVAEVKGSVVNDSGNLYEAKAAIEFFLSNTSQTVNLTAKFGKIYSEDNVIRFLEDGHVLYIARGVYSNSTSPTRTGGHALIVFGYVYINGQYRFLIRDPSPLGVGSTQIVSYQYLVFGQNAQAGDPSDSSIWDQTLVYVTSYAEETLSDYLNQNNP